MEIDNENNTDAEDKQVEATTRTTQSKDVEALDLDQMNDDAPAIRPKLNKTMIPPESVSDEGQLRVSPTTPKPGEAQTSKVIGEGSVSGKGEFKVPPTIPKPSAVEGSVSNEGEFKVPSIIPKPSEVQPPTVSGHGEGSVSGEAEFKVPPSIGLKPSEIQPPTVSGEGSVRSEAEFKVPPTIGPKPSEIQSPTVSGEGSVRSEAEFKFPPTIGPKPSGTNPSTEGSFKVPTITAPKVATAERRPPPDPKPTRPPKLDYSEPAWSGLPPDSGNFSLDVLKSGVIIDSVPLGLKPFVVFGRLDCCDVRLEHPSISRYHAVLQYKAVGDRQSEPGFYLYDLGSTHSSWINKTKVRPRVYTRLSAGSLFKLGGSTRLYILQGVEEEGMGGESLTQLSQQAATAQVKRQQLADKGGQGGQEGDTSRETGDNDDSGISWGMAEDAVEEPSAMEAVDPVSLDEYQPAEFTDPKKTLRGFFEREGYELEYETEEIGYGHNRQHKCKVKLPLEDSNGNPIYAEGLSSKKKEAVLACALEACRVLDLHGVLRQSHHEGHKRKSKDWEENDFYDSDEDTFLDRTGNIERKRTQRMKRAGKQVGPSTVDDYDSLLEKLGNLEKEMKSIEVKLEQTAKSSAIDARGQGSSAKGDSLEEFMTNIRESQFSSQSSRPLLKLKLVDLRKEEVRLKKLLRLVTPTSLPSLKTDQKVTHVGTSKLAAGMTTSRVPPKIMVGSIKGGQHHKKLKTITITPPVAAAAVPTSSELIQAKKLSDKMEVSHEGEEAFTTDSTKADEGEGGKAGGVKNVDIGGVEQRAREEIESGAAAPEGLESQIMDIEQIDPNVAENLKSVACDDTMTTTSTTATDELQHPESGDNESQEQQHQQQESMTEQQPKHAGKKKAKKSKKRVAAVAYEAKPEGWDDGNYVEHWAPPKSQTGDGRTYLNDKFGY